MMKMEEEEEEATEPGRETTVAVGRMREQVVGVAKTNQEVC